MEGFSFLSHMVHIAFAGFEYAKYLINKHLILYSHTLFILFYGFGNCDPSNRVDLEFQLSIELFDHSEY